MGLSDADKKAIEWAGLLPGLLRAIGNMTDDDDLRAAADALAAVPVERIGRVLGKLRTDRVSIDRGTGEIGDGVAVEVVDG